MSFCCSHIFFNYFPGMRPSAPILCLSVYIETLYHIYSGFWSKTILTFLTNVFNYTPTQFNCPAVIGIAIFNCGPWLIFMYTFGTKHKLDYAIAGVFITFSDSSSLFYFLLLFVRDLKELVSLHIIWLYDMFKIS